MAALASNTANDMHRPAGAPLVGPDSTASPLIVPSVSTVLPFLGGAQGRSAGTPLAAKNR